jgi:DNA repair protein RadA/Sms
MFCCIECENVYRARFDRCPKCGAWESCQRQKITRERVTRLSDISSGNEPRITIRKDWDRVLGGGAKAGTAIIVAGKPGAGKTSEMLSLAMLSGTRKTPALYLSSERSLDDLADAAKVMGIDATNIAPVRVRTMRDVRQAIERISPTTIFLDSATNLERFEADDMIDVREAVGHGVCFVICHVTKAQEIAGRNGLAHHAAAIVWIRGKTLRVTKNWHGPAPLSVRRLMPKFR